MKKTKKQLEKLEAEKVLVEEVRNDFFERQQARRSIEAQWQLNLNFYMGSVRY